MGDRRAVGAKTGVSPARCRLAVGVVAVLAVIGLASPAHGGVTPGSGAMGEGFVAPVPLQGLVSLADPEAFVTAAYVGLLGREPDAGGRQHWLGVLDRGVSPRTVLGHLARSGEHVRLVVAGAYSTFLRRSPDPGGLQWWSDRLVVSRSVTSLRAEIIGSAEYLATQGGGTIRGFVESTYQDVLGRTPDGGGLAHWTERIEAGVSRRHVGWLILSSSEAFRLTDLPAQTVTPRPGARSESLDVEVRVGVSLEEASTVLVSVAGRALPGTVGVHGQSITFSPSTSPDWVALGSRNEVVVTVLGYHGGEVNRFDYSFSYLAPQPIEVSSFTTPLVPGQPRNVNIRRAAELLDGRVIQPGARFSMNAALGERTRARGFVPNGFISGGETLSAVGGGVSQTSTTFMNAAWFAGIEIESFRPHSIYFPRYPMCREATIVWGGLDLVVVNNSPHAITVRASATDREATVRFISLPWASVESFIGDPYNTGAVGGPFSVDCGRTITYPDGSTDNESYTWRYSQGYPG